MARIGMTGGLAGLAVETARRMRSVVLWIVGPAERLLRRSSTGDLPPLWLRRHAGPVRSFHSSAEQSAAMIQDLALLRPGNTVLDIGCGPGAMATEFQKFLSTEGRYIGFDVHRASIAWCRKRFAPDPRFKFELAEIETPYSPGSTGTIEGFHFPAASESCDFVLAKSVFTHLLEPESRHYLREISRVLRPGRAALVTAFLFDPDLPEISAFPFRLADSRVRWRLRSRPHAAVSYERGLFESLVASAGLRVERMIEGFYPGSAARPTGQDVLILVKS